MVGERLESLCGEEVFILGVYGIGSYIVRIVLVVLTLIGLFCFDGSRFGVFEGGVYV